MYFFVQQVREILLAETVLAFKSSFLFNLPLFWQYKNTRSWSSDLANYQPVSLPHLLSKKSLK